VSFTECLVLYLDAITKFVIRNRKPDTAEELRRVHNFISKIELHNTQLCPIQLSLFSVRQLSRVLTAFKLTSGVHVRDWDRRGWTFHPT
jgi:hypothetical protein